MKKILVLYGSAQSLTALEIVWQEETDCREERVERGINRVSRVKAICDVNNGDCVERLMYKTRKEDDIFTTQF